MVWPETETAKTERRHELVLSGPSVEKRIRQSGLDEDIFGLSHLNFLEISEAGLTEISVGLGNLSTLTNLVLCNNKLKILPDVFDSLDKLKYVNLSNNLLSSLPASIGNLSQLQSLDVSNNCLKELPTFENLEFIHVVVVSNNELTSLPDGISASLTHLQTIDASSNHLASLPSEMDQLLALKNLNLSNNNLNEVPVSLGNCAKLKELDLRDNKLKDKRLAKMVKQCHTKSVLDYLRTVGAKQSGGGGGGRKGKKSKAPPKSAPVAEDIAAQIAPDLPRDMVKVIHFSQGRQLVVKMNSNVSEVRGHIVCCAVHGVCLSKMKTSLKQFISLQTRLHEDLCAKRQTATIATHDLDSLNFPLIYESMEPDEIMIVPLHEVKPICASALVQRLWNEADEIRKEKKRNTVSGIHKYLDLLRNKERYASLSDTSGRRCISFPPITNCEQTRISANTKSILIEVTSQSNLAKAKEVMEALLFEMFRLGLTGAEMENGSGDEADDELNGAAKSDASSDFTRRQIIIEQVRIVDNVDEQLRVVYPSRVDLTKFTDCDIDFSSGH